MNTQTNRLHTNVNQTVILPWKQTTKQQQQQQKRKTKIIQSGVCAGRPLKRMWLSYNKKEQSMYDSKNDSNMYSSLKLNIYSF